MTRSTPSGLDSAARATPLVELQFPARTSSERDACQTLITALGDSIAHIETALQTPELAPTNAVHVFAEALTDPFTALFDVRSDEDYHTLARQYLLGSREDSLAEAAGFCYDLQYFLQELLTITADCVCLNLDKTPEAVTLSLFTPDAAQQTTTKFEVPQYAAPDDDLDDIYFDEVNWSQTQAASRFATFSEQIEDFQLSDGPEAEPKNARLYLGHADTAITLHVDTADAPVAPPGMRTEEPRVTHGDVLPSVAFLSSSMQDRVL